MPDLRIIAHFLSRVWGRLGEYQTIGKLRSLERVTLTDRDKMVRVFDENRLSQVWHSILSCELLAMELEEEVLAACQKAVEIDPRFSMGWMDELAPCGRPRPAHRGS